MQMSYMVVVLGLPACSPSPEKRTVPTEYSREDALAALRRAVLEQPALFGRADYNPPSIPNLDEAIEKAIKDRNFGKTPASAAEAERFGAMIAPRIWGVYLDTPEGKAAFEARVRDHWENAPVRIDELNGVMTDLGVCPGPLRRNSKGALEMDECEFHEAGGFSARELVRRLESLRTKHPGAKAYTVSVTFRSYRLPLRVHYRYDAREDRLYVQTEGVPVTYRSPSPLGGQLSKLVTGEEPARTKDMEPVHQNLRVGPPR
ncbi:MAG: hypothetical protein FJW39_04490 [Acidobacteria bacterium]|nr:hypothetical protein [Acidobacteriota bacterium]